jgi:uncharacterized membrane protein
MEFWAFFGGLLVLFLVLGFPIWMLVLLFAIRKNQENIPAGNDSPALDELESKISALQGNVLHELKEIRRELSALRTPSASAAPPPVPSAPAEPAPIPIPAVHAAPIPPPATTRPSVPPPFPPRPEPIRPPASAARAIPEIESAALVYLRKAWNWLIVGEEFRRKDVSIEYAIATNWLVRVSILIVLFGVVFFLKESIDRGYLGPVGRVSLSTITGAAMLAGGLRLFGRRYHLLGQGLAGGGIGVLYFSLYAAGPLFALVPLAAAFAGMALITVVSGTLAVRFQSLLIAILGLLGGYLTPVLLSTGEKNLPFLFTYLLLLGFCMLGVAWKRQWPVVTWIAFACHSVLVGAALNRHFAPEDFQLVIGFLTAFFILFSTAVFIYNLATRTRASLLELIGLLLAAFVFFGFGYWTILATWPGRQDFAAILSLGLCIYYVIHVYALQLRGFQDKGLQTVFLGLGAIFLAVTLPLLFSKGWLTVTWSAEALVLLWMSRKLESPVLRMLSGVLYTVVIGRLCFHDLADRFRETPDSFQAYLRVLGPRLLQFGMPIASLAGAWRLLKLEKEELTTVPAAQYRAASSGQFSALALVMVFAVLFLYLNCEVYRFCTVLYRPLLHPGLTLVWIGLGAVILAFRRSLGSLPTALLAGLLTLAVLVKLTAYDLPAWHPQLDPFHYAIPYSPGFVFIRLFDFGLIAGFAVVMFRLLKPDSDLRHLGLSAGWLALALLLGYLTLELGAALYAFLPAFHRGGISLLWASFAFAVLFGGIRNRVLSLRLAGLALFAVVVWKIFFVDLRHLEAIYRIIAFIVFGVVLMLASFLYLKNKDLFETHET